ncbi:D-lyxose/D-mannose family sugar isomerase [Coraliomargarita sp. SDUM461004]|uniref:D-lyxose ketol-isomerase n=1 Tax=Thalassobacterium sedimentorum TaxID=3041258 RepID=A0ABU1AQT4_9BACT|nr:D-lyxose/D-mannose family sugar isomerase [Coraliomargarita sp. SDUM461004]MDQ8196131.1 D-lyxose/D-mannose family sugar isomerase [Coraliomargarita sp. SDUM461004]
MKRSELNTLIQNAESLLQKYCFHLPPFAFWTPEDWNARGSEADEIREQQLGWDITDFGSGDFSKVGLLLFTLRNGTFEELDKPLGKIYGEKLLIAAAGQVTPIHFHHQKMEDIINRGGGRLVLQLWNSNDDNSLADSPVTVSRDGLSITLDAGQELVLTPGESVCLPQRLYHTFWAHQDYGPVLIGEVNRVNDDRIDNHFYESVGRFPEIEEDVAPLRLLTIDYPNFANA